MIFFLSLFLTCNTTSVYSLPSFISLESRVKESDTIFIGDVIKVSTRKLNASRVAIGLRIKIVKLLKGKSPPKSFSVNFTVNPSSWERLRKPPPTGRYYIFMTKKVVKDSKGRVGTVLVLYDPNIFAFEKYDKQTRKEMNAIMKK